MVPEPDARKEFDRPARMTADFPVAMPEALGNDYSTLVKNARTGEMPTTPITVVIPLLDSARGLEMTLLALTHQTYPTSLTDIVVAVAASVDEPNDLVAAVGGQFRSVRCVRQHDTNVLSSVRNMGIDAATTEWVVLLDGGVVPVRRLVELYARHLQAEGRAVYCGHRRAVDNGLLETADVATTISEVLRFADQQVSSDEDAAVDWRLAIYRDTHALRFEPHPFRCVQAGNIGFSASMFDRVGPFDDQFGGSDSGDIEWGYRAWNSGYFIIPIVDSYVIQSESRDGRYEIDSEPDEPRALLEERCPIPFRSARAGRSADVPLVSIYMPVYNAVDTVGLAIQSALDQTMADLEVCVVDDGSTDGTAELIDEWFGTNPRVRLEHQSNEGIGSASNRAVRMCRAPFIGQLDADDQLKPHAVGRLLHVLRSDSRVGVAYSSSELIDESGSRVGHSYEFPHYNRYMLMYLMIIHHFRLFRARDWYRTDGFATDIKNAVDYDMFLKMSEVTDMVHVPEQLYQYRKHGSSTSQASHQIQRANHRLAVQRAMDRRGLSAGWRMVPDQPVDVRKYEFRRHKGAVVSHFGAGPDMVRLSIDDGWQRDDAVSTLHELFPAWTVETRRRLGEPRVESPQLSHARAIRAIETIAEHFPRDAIRLVYA